MIKIVIQTDGEKIFDSFETKETTILENAIVLRRLKEMERDLLDMEYESENEITYDNGVKGNNMQEEEDL